MKRPRAVVSPEAKKARSCEEIEAAIDAAVREQEADLRSLTRELAIARLPEPKRDAIKAAIRAYRAAELDVIDLACEYGPLWWGSDGIEATLGAEIAPEFAGRSLKGRAMGDQDELIVRGAGTIIRKDTLE